MDRPRIRSHHVDLGCDLRSRFLLQICYLPSPSDWYQAALAATVTPPAPAAKNGAARELGGKNWREECAIIWCGDYRRGDLDAGRLKRRALAIHHRGGLGECVVSEIFGIGCRG